MIEDVRQQADVLDDFVAFAGAGTLVDGEFRCAECRYGICVRGRLPRCPMCSGESWEPSGPPVAADEPSAS